MPKDHIDITSDTSVEAILEDLPGAEAVLVKHFGAGVKAPGQTWMRESLSRACLIRGVDEQKVLADLRKLPRKA